MRNNFGGNQRSNSYGGGNSGDGGGGYGESLDSHILLSSM